VGAGALPGDGARAAPAEIATLDRLNRRKTSHPASAARTAIRISAAIILLKIGKQADF
jgi:hypothetical protein